MIKIANMAGWLKKYCILVFIIALAGYLRFYKLGVNPPSLDWDEVSLGYNAWSLLQTGHDEFGNSWPLSIRSFGDYKPPLYVYTLVPTLKIFGKSEFAIRLPSAIAGTLTVLITYFLAQELCSTIQPSSRSIALWSSFLLAISPWHLQFSRIAFEANLGLFFFVSGAWLLLRSLQRRSSTPLFFSVFSFSLSLMAYHSIRFVAPLFIFALFWMFRNNLPILLRKNKHLTAMSSIIALATASLVFYTIFIQRVGQARFSQTSLFTISSLLATSNARIEAFNHSAFDKVVNYRGFAYATQYVRGYLDHYNLRFWFLDGDRIDRHRTPGVGLLYIFESPFLLLGFFSVAKNSRAKKSAKILTAWFFLAPSASALTGGTPSAVRSLLFLPTFQIIASIGIVTAGKMTSEIKQMRIKKPLLAFFYFLFASTEVGYYLHQYYVHAPLEYAKAWQYGYRQTVKRIMSTKQNYQSIIFTTSYDQPYIYFLWYGNYDPGILINNGEFNKQFDVFQFRRIDWQEVKTSPKTLVVGDQQEMNGTPVSWSITYPDHSTAFLAAETP